MARYILFEIDDDAKAVALAKKLKGVEGIELRAIFQRPTEYCQCSYGIIKPISVEGVTRKYREPYVRMTERLNWRVCVLCKKPVPEAQHLRNVLEKFPAGTPLAQRGTTYWLDVHWLVPWSETAFNPDSAWWAREQAQYGTGLEEGRREVKRARRAARKARR